MIHVDATEPYPWPYDADLQGGRLALVLAGWDDSWQRNVDSTEATDAADRCEALAAVVSSVGGLVVGVAHGGAAALAPACTGAAVLEAVGLDGFWGGPLDDRLRAGGRTHLLIAGHGLEAPVHSLLRGANDRGYECLLVADACSALDPSLRAAATSMVCMSGGIFGAVGRTADVLDTLTTLIPITTGAFP